MILSVVIFDINRLTAVDNFIYGCKLGLVMTAEAFVGINDLTSDKGSTDNECDEKRGGNCNIQNSSATTL